MANKPKKSWAEKIASAPAHEVKRAPVKFADIPEGAIMLLPSPQIIDKFLRAMKPGETMDSKTLRIRLAKKYKAEIACPVVTGIHLRQLAEAVNEALERGANVTDVTPVWRVLDEKSSTLKRISFDPAFMLLQREKEARAAGKKKPA